MTDNNHPITPPLELMQQWISKHYGTKVDRELGGVERTIAAQAARWGADQELEACCEILRGEFNYHHLAEPLRAARRPKPPSLKEQALETLRSMQIEPVILDGINVNKEVMDKYDIIRRAIESLPE